MKHKLLITLGFVCLLLIHLLVLKNITFTAWPEMFSYPYLINKDFLIYRDFAHPYVPFLTFILAFYYKVFGMNLFTHQNFVWMLILFNDLLVFLIAKKMLRGYRSLLPIGFYVFLQPIFEGNMLWFDLATVPFVLGGFLVFVYIKQIPRRLFWFGFLLMISVLIKQQAVVLLGLVFLILLLAKETRLRIQFFILGAFLPVCFTFLILLTVGAFDEYIFWTLEFPLYWLPKFPGYSEMPTKKNILLMMILFGLPSVLLIKNFLKNDLFSRIVLVSIIASIVMAFPRFSYFHLQPAIAVLAVFTVTALKNSRKFGVFFILISLFIGIWLWKDYRPFIGVTQARFYDLEDMEFSEFVKQNTTIKDRVYFLGPHSLHYALSDRTPPLPWIDNYVWHFEIPGIQENQIKGLMREEHMVIFKIPPQNGQWYQLGVYQPKQIEEYIKNSFELVKTHKSGVEVWKKKR